MMFIRPWFLLLLLMPIVFYFWNKKTAVFNPWSKIIAKSLQPFLLFPNGVSAIQRRFLPLTVVWCLLTLAAAGPFVSYDEVEGERIMPANVVVMDVSPATDTIRLNIEKMKLNDFLNHLKQQGEQVGLVLYSADGYTAVPVTPDLELIRQTALDIKPGLLPDSGNNPIAGLNQAKALLDQTSQDGGRVFLLTSGGFDEADFVRETKSFPYKIGILGVGQEGIGAPLTSAQGDFLKDSSGRIMTAGLNPNELKKAGVYVGKTPDTSDVKMLIDQTQTDASGGKAADDRVRIPYDLGPWLVLITLPIMALLFRRGVFFIWLMYVCGVTPAYADMFRRPDQIEYDLMQNAHDLFQQGQYVQAADRYGQIQSKEGMYNQATVTAFSGDLKKSLKLFERVLEKYPDYEDALYNKNYIEELLKQQEQEQQKNESSDRQNSSDKNQNDSEKDRAVDSSESKQGESENQVDQKNNSENRDSESNQAGNDSENGSDNGMKNGMNNAQMPNQNMDKQSMQSAQQSMSDTPLGDLQNSQPESIKADSKQQTDINQQNKQLSQSNDLSNQQIQESGQQDTNGDQTESGMQQVYEKADVSAQESKTGQGYVSSTPQVDQESQQIFNKIQQDSSRILRYRLYRQQLRKLGQQTQGGGK